MAYLLRGNKSGCCLAYFFIWDLNSLYFSASIPQSGPLALLSPMSSPPEWIVKIIGIANFVRILAMSSHCRSKYFNQKFFTKIFHPAFPTENFLPWSPWSKNGSTVSPVPPVSPVFLVGTSYPLIDPSPPRTHPLSTDVSLLKKNIW